MLRTVLVPVDGSDGAESGVYALKQILPLARAEHSIIRVISVVPPYEGELRLVGVRQHVSDMLTEPYRHALERAAETAEAAGASIRTILKEGEPYEEIVEAAETHGCDLIVMGGRDRNPAEELLMGSVTRRVIGYSHADVLVIRIGTTLHTNSVVVAVDGSEASDRAAYLAFGLQKSYGGRLTVISVADVPSHLYGIAPEAALAMVESARKHVEKVKTMGEADGIAAEFLLLEGDPARIIIDAARERNSGLIVMGSHGRTGLKRLLMGSVTERVVGRAPCPVLVERA